MTPDTERYLFIGAGLFIIGAIGFITRRNLILMVLSTELMLHGVSLTLVTFGHVHQTQEGQAFTIFTLTVAACEAGLALAFVLALYRTSHSLDVQVWSQLRESDLSGPPLESGGQSETTTGHESLPRLTPAGVAPKTPARTFAVPPTTSPRT